MMTRGASGGELSVEGGRCGEVDDKQRQNEMKDDYGGVGGGSKRREGSTSLR